jgi:hypothetical protein
MDYPGKVITKTQVTPTQTSASGNWTLDDQAAAIKNNNWPVALVPNPISKSLRFNSADSAYLNRTFGTPTNRNIWTWSGWIKRSALGNAAGYRFFEGGDGTSANSGFIGFGDGASNEYIRFYNRLSSTTNIDITTAAVFRDVSAWYHVVVAYDSAQATQANRLLMYVNGVNYTWSGIAPPLNQTSGINTSAYAHNIGVSPWNTSTYFSGYITEVNFIDGQALTPSSFGMTNPQTGQWIPLKYSGTYGTNGFYLNFKDATSTTTLGYDYSGNANNWTTNNFSVTAGAGNDSLTDVPTPWFAYNTTGDVGGVIRGNYCTLNPLSTTATLADGNLNYSSGTKFAAGTIFQTSGKFYAECVASGTFSGQGIVWGFSSGNANMPSSATPGVASINGTWYVYSGGGLLTAWIDTAFGSNYSNPFTVGQTWQFAVDVDNGKAWLGQNNTWYDSSFGTTGNPSTGANPTFTISSPTTRNGLNILCGNNTAGGTFTFNFGQRPFAYTPPTGFRSLCTTNLPATAIGFGLTNQGDDYFNPVLYTGNGTSQTISTGLQPDFIWIKRRDGAAANTLTDSVRGISKQLFSNLTDAEQTDADSGVTAISSSSITLGDNNLAVGSVNGSGSTYVAWNWKASGSTVSNTAGTVTSTVSANTTAGFSVVTWTGSASASNQTVGHGLGSTPNMVILKNRSVVDNWFVYHSSATTNTQYLNLNTTAAVTTAGSNTWGAGMTSTLVGLRPGTFCSSSSDNVVMYCFAAVAGYSAFGSYTGNASTDGPFIYTGFRPRFVLIKRTDTTNDWFIIDTSRNTYNVAGTALFPNSTSSETTNGYYDLDIVSNGFKARTSNAATNASGGTYIYAAFAESPFQFANAR